MLVSQIRVFSTLLLPSLRVVRASCDRLTVSSLTSCERSSVVHFELFTILRYVRFLSAATSKSGKVTFSLTRRVSDVKYSMPVMSVMSVLPVMSIVPS